MICISESIVVYLADNRGGGGYDLKDKVELGHV